MSKRGWKYRCYADEPETPLADFVCAFLGGTTGFYGLIGWVLISWGVTSAAWVGILCVTVGLALGVWQVYDK